MSRSRRKTPIIGITSAPSDKPWKVAEHKRERRVTRAVLALSLDGDDARLHGRNYGDPWCSEKDGKAYWPDERTYRK
jgi:hypothetical protein